MKKVEEVCLLSGVSKRTLQYYDNEGVLPAKRSKENYRLYDEDALKRLWEILWYKEMGFNLEEIKALLAVPQEERNSYLERKIQSLEGKIQDLEKQKRFIRQVEKYGIIPLPEKEGRKGENYREYIKKMKG